MAKKIDDISPLDQIEGFLDDNKEYHYNNEQEHDYIVSSGSLILDIEMGGGIRPGICRFSGVSEGGKTSCALSFAKNFIESRDDSFVVYIQAERGLSKNLRKRSGLEKYENTRFKIIRTNVYETAIQLINDLIKNNPKGTKYMFVIDSMDGLNLKEDMNRVFGESNKVAGSAALSADFLKKMTLPLFSYGHICIMISQVRSKVSINPYAKTDPRITNASGGNALIHFSDWILEFQERFVKDRITTEPNGKGEILGHFCKIVFRKTMNEKSGVEISYPIKSGRVDGKSIWVEYEIVDLMLQYGMATKKGAWITIDPDTLSELAENNISFPDKFQGLENFKTCFEENEEARNYFYGKFKDTLQKDA